MRFMAFPALPPTIAVALVASCGSHAADGRKTAQETTIAVVDFVYRDTSREERDQRQEHEARLKDFMTALKGDLAAQGKNIVSLPCEPAPCSVAGGPADDLLRAAREAGAGMLLVGSIQKMSTLVQWAKAEAIDTRTERMVLDKLFTFRGDTDESWHRAEAFVAGELAVLQQAGAR
jgi:Protein of unknown function (DUF2380)